MPWYALTLIVAVSFVLGWEAHVIYLRRSRRGRALKRLLEEADTWR